MLLFDLFQSMCCFCFDRHGNKLPGSQWSSLLIAEDGDFTHITMVIDLMLTFPPASVSCETTFSQMKLIKTVGGPD